VFFGHSIVSDWQNPIAIFSRALLRAFNVLGHETRFLEERGNRATVALLQACGSGPLREFARDYPDIVYRTYKLPKGMERTVWLARELGDVDVAVALDDAPAELLAELARVPLPRLIRVILLTTDNPPPFSPDILLRLSESTSTDTTKFAADLIAMATTELDRRRKLPLTNGIA
jgi:hypothetical protein